MKTVLLGSMPPEVDALLARRRALGIDLYDEVWEGSYHMAPAPHSHRGIVASELRAALRPAARRAGLIGTDPFNLGSPDDYRVPDGGFLEEAPSGMWVDTARVVLEVVSPDDETYEKLEFYAMRHVDELVIADPSNRSVRLLVRDAAGYRVVERSEILGVTTSEIIEAIDWP